MSGKPNILILCTGNSCRSQMAEGYFRHYASDRFTALSAGMSPKGAVHPLAAQVMREDGVDISGQHPKDVQEFLGRTAVQHLVIVCDKANDSCPTIFPGMLQRHYWPFDDPDAFHGSQAETINEFRRVRDQIKQRIVDWLAHAQA